VVEKETLRLLAR